jgi:hypothetical protein
LNQKVGTEELSTRIDYAKLHWKTAMKITKQFRIKVSFLLSIVFISILFITSVSAAPQSEIDEAQRKMNETRQKIEAVKKQRETIIQQINSETQGQQTLIKEAEELDRSMESNTLQIKILELEIEEIDHNIEGLKLKMENAEADLKKIQVEIVELKAELSDSLNLVMKRSVNAPSFLDKASNFQQSIIDEEKQKALSRLIKDQIAKVKELETKAIQTKDDIAAKQKEIATISEEKKAQNNNLAMQKEALQMQKNYKIALAEQSKQKQANLSSQQNELAQNQQKLDDEYAKEAQRLNELINSVISQPINGTRVSGGQVIGFQGRTGLSCNPLVAGVQKTNNFCEKYAGTGPNWYYYDHIKYPDKGSHLHFQYTDANKRKDRTIQYLQPGSAEFVRKPMDRMNINYGRGYHDDYALDITNYHGAPIYAVKSGVVTYVCDTKYPPNFPDPGYGAIIKHDDGSISVSWHMQRRADSPQCIIR